MLVAKLCIYLQKVFNNIMQTQKVLKENKFGISIIINVH